MALKVVGHRVMIKPDPVEKEHVISESLKLYLVKDERMERVATQTGTVVGIGETAWYGFADGRPWCSVGDRVIFAQYAGKFVKDPETEEEFIVINDEDIQTVILSGVTNEKEASEESENRE